MKSKAQTIAIGIDLGTTSSSVGVWKNDHVQIIPNESGAKRIPSCVSFLEDNITVGGAFGSQTSNFPTISNVKRIIGRRFRDLIAQKELDQYPFTIEKGQFDRPMIVVNLKGQARKFHPQQICSMILMRLKQTAELFLGHEVSKAVISIPSNFSNNQRQATKDAGHIAGLHVLRLVNESTAAAICYGLNSRTGKQEKYIIVYDLGGGKLDVSLMILEDGIYEVRAVSGSTRLGGVDFDQKLVEYCAGEILKGKGIDVRGNRRVMRRLRILCEKAKKVLSTSTEATIEVDGIGHQESFSICITRNKFQQLCLPLFKQTLLHVQKVLKQSGLSKNQINDIVLVGGSSRIPKISFLLQQFFNDKSPCTTINPQQAVVYGAAINAALLSGQDHELINNILVIDVNPASIGFEVAGGVMLNLIPKNTSIPSKKSQVFTTYSDSSCQLMIHIFEGERSMTKDNYLLGSFEIAGWAPAPRGVPQIEVTFQIDSNCILSVYACDKTSSRAPKITITRNKERLSREETQQLVIQAGKYKGMGCVTVIEKGEETIKEHGKFLPTVDDVD